MSEVVDDTCVVAWQERLIDMLCGARGGSIGGRG